MKSNWITIYPLDLSSCHVIYYEGFFSYHDLTEAVGMNNFLFTTDHTIEFITDKNICAYWDLHSETGYKLSPFVKRFECFDDFQAIFKPLEYSAQFEALLK